MNKIILKTILLVLVFSMAFFAYSSEPVCKEMDNLSFIIDFEFKEFPNKPFLSEGRILLPMRDFFEAIGANVEWKDETKEINVSFEENKMFLKIASKDSIVNGTLKTLDVPPMLVNDMTYIPLRFAGESLGYEIIWNEEFKTIYAFSNIEEAYIPELTEDSHLQGSIPNDTKIIDSFTGTASWYGGKFHGRNTSSGEVFDQYALTGAHKTLPFGTFVRVTHTLNNQSVIIKINDRGPHVANRVIDLSMAAAEIIGLKSRGLGETFVEVLENYY